MIAALDSFEGAAFPLAFDRIEIWAPAMWSRLSDEGNDALKDAMRDGGL